MGTNTLTPQLVAEWLAYDPTTGRVTWRKSPASNVVIGQEAGNICKAGYREIRVRNVRTYAHRIAFILMTGTAPRRVDHRDRNRSNNKWENLRACTQSQNLANTSQRQSTTGVRGVERTCSGYAARIKFEGRRYYLGHFKTIVEACTAYENKARELFGDFMCQND